MDKKLFSKGDAWGDGLAEEAKRRNCQLLCAARSHPSERDLPSSAFIVGFALCRVSGLNTHLLKLAVVPELRRQGVGRALLGAVVADTRQRRGGSLSLHVAEGNAPALALYRSAGFESEGLLQDYYSPGRHALKLRLELA